MCKSAIRAAKLAKQTVIWPAIKLSPASKSARKRLRSASSAVASPRRPRLNPTDRKNHLIQRRRLRLRTKRARRTRSPRRPRPRRPRPRRPRPRRPRPRPPRPRRRHSRRQPGFGAPLPKNAASATDSTLATIPTNIALNQSYPLGVAVDNQYVYWANNGDGNGDATRQTAGDPLTPPGLGVDGHEVAPRSAKPSASRPAPREISRSIFGAHRHRARSCSNRRLRPRSANPEPAPHGERRVVDPAAHQIVHLAITPRRELSAVRLVSVQADRVRCRLP